MYLCDNGHEEIVHEGANCPLCESMQENEVVEAKVAYLENELEEMTAEAAECIST